MISRKTISSMALTSLLMAQSSVVSAQLVDLPSLLANLSSLTAGSPLASGSGLNDLASGLLSGGLSQGDSGMIGNTDNSSPDNRTGANAVDGGGGGGPGGDGGVFVANGGSGGAGANGGGNYSNNSNTRFDDRVNNRNQHNMSGLGL